jgi:hypothetical protein
LKTIPLFSAEEMDEAAKKQIAYRPPARKRLLESTGSPRRAIRRREENATMSRRATQNLPRFLRIRLATDGGAHSPPTSLST